MTDIRTAVTGERADLAALLGELPAAEWDRPTLCEGWRVREVVAHIVMPYRLSTAGFVLGMLRNRGRFNRFADQHARREAAALSPAELAETLRQNIDHPWKPPGGGDQGALSHDVIHGLDMTVALGIDRLVPLERMRFILEKMDPRSVTFFGVDLDGIQLRATDLDWSYGEGTPLTGTAQDLLLVLSGRKLPPNHLTGPAAARFTTGITR
jgi:uncharacterized protein (TIGR03083 family)